MYSTVEVADEVRSRIWWRVAMLVEKRRWFGRSRPFSSSPPNVGYYLIWKLIQPHWRPYDWWKLVLGGPWIWGEGFNYCTVFSTISNKKWLWQLCSSGILTVRRQAVIFYTTSCSGMLNLRYRESLVSFFSILLESTTWGSLSSATCQHRRQRPAWLTDQSSLRIGLITRNMYRLRYSKI